MNKSPAKPISLDKEDRQRVFEALVAYANAAYPPGGSECAQASHQALVDLARAVVLSDKKPLKIKKRQLPMVKAAINWYYSSDSDSDSNTGRVRVDTELLISKLK